MKFVKRIALLAGLTGAVLAQSGCKGCNNGQQAKPVTTEVAKPVEPAVAPPEAVSPVTAVSPTDAPVYPGPRSESVDHFRVTTGFSTQAGAPLPQPQALEKNVIYVSVLDPDGHPLGQFERVERGEMHGFLVARDMRQALYASAVGPVKEGADARSLTFEPREGGDHALVTVFQPKGGSVHVVTTPVAIKGALPEVVGPGVESLSGRAKTAQEDRIQLTTTPTQIVAGQAVQLLAQDLDDKGNTRGEIKLPYVVILNDQMGFGDVVEWDSAGKASWLPPRAGTYLVLAPPTRGEQALSFKLVVTAPPSK